MRIQVSLGGYLGLIPGSNRDVYIQIRDEKKSLDILNNKSRTNRSTEQDTVYTAKIHLGFVKKCV